MAASSDDQLARIAYEAYRDVLEDVPPPWAEAGAREQAAWRAAVNAVVNRGEVTVAAGRTPHSLVLEVGDETRVFKEEFTAGRQGKLRVPDEHASSQHAVFGYAHGYWYVEDLGSTNGTYLNGRRIFAAQRLKKGDRVRIGHTTLSVIAT